MMVRWCNAEHVAMDRVSFSFRAWAFESALRVWLKKHPQLPLESRSRPLQITVNGADDASWNTAGLFGRTTKGFDTSLQATSRISA